MVQAFVTGGSGFIGRALIKRLLSEGHTVRALARSEQSAGVLASLGAEPVLGVLTDETTWQGQVAGSAVLFHLAAETDLAAPRERHEAITVGGARAAVAAAEAAGVPRLVLCSSEAALMAGEPLLEVDETAPLRPDSEAAYSATKAAAEQLVLGANGPRLATVSVRPRFVWGPASSLVDGLVAAARAGQFAWIEGGRHQTDVTYIDNAVEGLILGWRNGRPGEAYFVTDQRRVELRDFLETMFDLYHVDTDIPELDAATAAVAVPVPARWFLSQPCLLRTDKASEQLGYSPVVSQADGMRAVAAALEAAH